MLYRVEISPFSTMVRKAMGNPFTGAKWILLFEDENGFEIATADVEVAGVTRLADGRGGFTGVEQKGSTSVAFDAYSKIQFIDVKWNGFPARSATDCVLVRDWDVKDTGEKPVLVLRLSNSCSQRFNLEGAVKLWDPNDQPLGDRRITIGEIAANENREIEYVFKQSDSSNIGSIKFLGLR